MKRKFYAVFRDIHAGAWTREYDAISLADTVHQINRAGELGDYLTVKESDFHWNDVMEVYLNIEEEFSIYISENEVACYKAVIEHEFGE